MRMAIVRLVVMLLLMLNQILISKGWTPLPYDEEELFEYINGTALFIVGVWTWWKNNNVTKNAQKAQDYKNNLDKE